MICKQRKEERKKKKMHKSDKKPRALIEAKNIGKTRGDGEQRILGPKGFYLFWHCDNTLLRVVEAKTQIYFCCLCKAKLYNV